VNATLEHKYQVGDKVCHINFPHLVGVINIQLNRVEQHPWYEVKWPEETWSWFTYEAESDLTIITPKE
jgi:hypothetical protein